MYHKTHIISSLADILFELIIYVYSVALQSHSHFKTIHTPDVLCPVLPHITKQKKRKQHVFALLERINIYIAN